jgi:ATP dependent DNA ligase domain
MAVKTVAYKEDLCISAAGSSRRRSLNAKSKCEWSSHPFWHTSKAMPDIARVAAELDCMDAVIDGEVVALDEKGVSNFALLQAAFQEETRREVTYFAFDLLHLNGRNLRDLPLLRRKELVARLLAQSGERAFIRYGEHLQSDGRCLRRPVRLEPRALCRRSPRATTHLAAAING